MNLSSFMYWARLYKLLIQGSIRSRMQYKFNFILASVLAALIQIADFLMVAIVLNKFGAIKGWTLYEVGYLFAVMTLSKTIYRTFASDVHHLERYLVNGELDQLLIRPVPVMLALMSQNFRIMLGELLQGGFVLGWAISGMMRQGQVDWMVVPLSMFVILTGAVILFSIGLATATVGFWITRITELQNITEDAARTAAQYPLVLYPNWLKSILLFAIPVGFVNYVPSLYILRDQAGAWVLLVVALAAIICLGLSLWFWRYGLTKYQSTGS
ncbi:ABC transporter permease [Marinicrinis lubricantis]|uniref:ABC transporter permease n=1 Tax=Marinicrinis lubricantis TaxID=2086470 RepID=A0ABW1IN75_9BACL